MPVSFRLAAFYAAFFVFAGLFVAYFPAYLAARGLAAAEIAWVLALPQIVRIFAPVAWGALADRTGRHRAIVIFGCAAQVACFALIAWAPGFAAIALLVGAASLASAAALPLVEAITLGVLAGKPARYGPIRVWGSIGFAAAVLGGGAWLDYHPVLELPGAFAAFAGAALVAALALPHPRIERSSTSLRVPVDRHAARLLAAAFCMSLAHGTLYAFLTLHLQARGYSGAMIGVLWTLGVLAEIVVFFLLPQIFRRHALSTILAASAALGVARFLAIGWAADWLAVLVVAQLLHAATFGAFHAASVTAVQRVFPPHGHGRGQALLSAIGYGAGGAAGALAAGWAWEAAGPGLAFTVSAAASAAGVLLAYPLKRAGL